MPRTSRTVSIRWSLGCAALLALAAVPLAAGGLDAPVLIAVNGAAARDLPAWLPSCLTVLGNGLVATMLVAPFLRRAPSIPAAALVAALPAALFSRAGKALAERPRPAAVLDPALLHIQGPVLAAHNSFPSGHSITIFLAATVIVLGSVPAAADQGAGPARAGGACGWPGALGLAALAMLVAASRLMVGAHWPSDVLGGASLGIVAGAIGTWTCRRSAWWRHPRVRRSLALVVFACAAILPWVDTGYPLARPVQWAGALFGLACSAAALLRPARSAVDVPERD
jgi:undecaprenyl-diphosphatase